MARYGRLASVLLLGLGVTSCWDEGDVPRPKCDYTLADGTCAGSLQARICVEEFCTAGVTCGRTLHVKAGGSGDGTKASPYGQIQDAAGKSIAGDCIVVAPGEYGKAALPGGVSLLGAGLEAVRISAPAGGYALEIAGSGQKGGVVRGVTITGDGRGVSLRELDGLRLEHSRIDGVRVVGVDARRCSNLVLDHVQIKNTRQSEQQEFGIGLLLAEGSRAELTRVAIADSAAQGVLAQESSVKLVSSAVIRAGFCGVAIDCAQDPACAGQLASSLDGSTIDHCGGVGLWARGAKLTVTNSDIGYTTIAGGVARGVELLNALLDLSGNRVHHNEGQGVLVDGARGKLSDNTIDQNVERGVWLQGVSGGLALENNNLLANRKAGFGSIGCTGVTLKGGQVSQTKKMPTGDGAGIAYVGDGLQILDKSQIVVDGVKVEGTERVGVLIDGARATISKATISGGEDLLVVQNASLADQTLSENRGAGGELVQAKVPAKAYFVNKEPVPTLKISGLPIPIP